MSDQTYRALCQDCLRAPKFDTEAEQVLAHIETTLCTCGGQLCACPSCLETIAALEEGRFDDAGLTVRITEWSAEGGAA